MKVSQNFDTVISKDQLLNKKEKDAKSFDELSESIALINHNKILYLHLFLRQIKLIKHLLRLNIKHTHISANALFMLCLGNNIQLIPLKLCIHIRRFQATLGIFLVTQ